MPEKITMTVQLEVTVPQALALQAMFEYWNFLGNIGSSRSVAFFVDGDGNFHPNCTSHFDTTVPTLTPELHEAAIKYEHAGARTYDFDRLASLLEGDH